MDTSASLLSVAVDLTSIVPFTKIFLPVPPAVSVTFAAVSPSAVADTVAPAFTVMSPSVVVTVRPEDFTAPSARSPSASFTLTDAPSPWNVPILLSWVFSVTSFAVSPSFAVTSSVPASIAPVWLTAPFATTVSVSAFVAPSDRSPAESVTLTAPAAESPAPPFTVIEPNLLSVLAMCTSLPAPAVTATEPSPTSTAATSPTASPALTVRLDAVILPSPHTPPAVASSFTSFAVIAEPTPVDMALPAVAVKSPPEPPSIVLLIVTDPTASSVSLLAP